MGFLKKSRCFYTEQVMPKCPEEMLSSDEENSNESVVPYMYSENSESNNLGNTSVVDFSFTNEEHSLGRTSQMPCIKSAPNFRTCLQMYKIKSATRIQQFFRLTKLKKQAKDFLNKLKKIYRVLALYKGLEKLKNWVRSRNNAAVAIQRKWRLFISRQKEGVPSPTRRLLAKAVNIGNKLLKIRKVIDKVVSSRGPSPPTSPIPFQNSDRICRSQSNVIFLKPSLSTDEPETIETINSTPNAAGHDKFRYSSIEFAPGTLKVELSLVMKRPFQIRTKRKQLLSLGELGKQLMIDQNNFVPWKPIKVLSNIPCLEDHSSYFSVISSETKEKLLCEYKELLKA